MFLRNNFPYHRPSGISTVARYAVSAAVSAFFSPLVCASLAPGDDGPDQLRNSGWDYPTINQLLYIWVVVEPPTITIGW